MFKKSFKPMRERSSGGTIVSFCSVPVEENNSGKDVVYKNLDLKSKVKPLPPPDMFSLKNQIASGIPMKEVNSVVFRENSVTPEMEQQITSVLDKEIDSSEEENV